MYNTKTLSRDEKDHLFFDGSRTASFLLEDKMPIGVYKRTKTPWNKGLHIYCGGKKFKKGHIPWNKGKEGPSGEKNGMWKGGKYKNEGYVYILKPQHPFAKKNGYVAEHRLIVEQCLGRYTTKQESIHHKNKERDDNRIENLMLLKNKSIHNKVDHNIPVNECDIIFNINLMKSNPNYYKKG